jgi:hypothetical protein
VSAEDEERKLCGRCTIKLAGYGYEIMSERVFTNVFATGEKDAPTAGMNDTEHPKL